jgi:hypothetical protein
MSFCIRLSTVLNLLTLEDRSSSTIYPPGTTVGLDVASLALGDRAAENVAKSAIQTPAFLTRKYILADRANVAIDDWDYIMNILQVFAGNI